MSAIVSANRTFTQHARLSDLIQIHHGLKTVSGCPVQCLGRQATPSTAGLRRTGAMSISRSDVVSGSHGYCANFQLSRQVVGVAGDCRRCCGCGSVRRCSRVAVIFLEAEIVVEYGCWFAGFAMRGILCGVVVDTCCIGDCIRVYGRER